MYLLMVQKDDFVTRKEDVQRAAKIMTKLIDCSASEVRELAFQVLGKMQDKFLSFIEKLLSDLNFTKRQKVNQYSSVRTAEAEVSKVEEKAPEKKKGNLQVKDKS